MTIFSTALASALSTLATAKGETLTYKTSANVGVFAALSGFVLHHDRPIGAAYDERHMMEAFTLTGILKGPLTPALGVGYQITDGNSDVWHVEQVTKDNQQVCAVKRVAANKLGPDRGGAS